MQERVEPIFHRKFRLRWLPKANEIDTKKPEMYMANVRPNARGPNATYIPSVHVCASVGSMGIRVRSLGVCVGSVGCFGYQHVGILNAKGLGSGVNPNASPQHEQVPIAVEA